VHPSHALRDTAPDQRSVVRPSVRRALLGAAVVIGVVLRWWDLGGPALSFDESFTRAYAQLPFGELLDALRLDDSHPPLDYLLRGPVAGGGAAAFRSPSAVASTLTLVVVVWWLGTRGWFGVAAVWLTALAPLQVFYAHQARLYALSILAGTVLAAASEHWLAHGSARVRWLAVGGLILGVASHSAVLLVAPGLVALAGRRVDREAWRWRASVMAVVGLWAVLWGPAALDQMSGGHATWIPFTTLNGLVQAVGGLVVFRRALDLLVLAGVVGGGLALRRLEPRLGTVWLWLFVLPVVAVAMIGLRTHVLLPRSVAFAAWGPVLALAAVLEWARRWRGTSAVAVSVLAILLVVTSLQLAVGYEEDSAAARRALADRVADGDAVVVHPAWLWPLAAADLGTPRNPTTPTSLEELSRRDAYVAVLPGAPFTGRVWVLQPDTYAFDTAGLVPCSAAPPRVDEGYVLGCYTLASAEPR
jgi:hypothetical protein